MKLKQDYKIGDIIVYSPFGGGERRLVVDEKDVDIKNGRPGFAGTLVGDDEYAVWGYDDQILRVEPKEVIE